MIDIVERLRDPVHWFNQAMPMRIEAADEIERLRAIIAEYEDKILHADSLRGPRGEPGPMREMK